MENNKFKKLSQHFTTYNKNFGDNVELVNSVNRKILQTRSKEEYDQKKLEYQQNKYLQGQWGNINQTVLNKTISYEPMRMPSYLDYELMEQYPIIGAALTTYAEECVTTNEKGQVLNINSESKRVRDELNELFYNRLHVQTSLYSDFRNTCKYGDNFKYLQVDNEKGVLGWKQLPIMDMERVEASMYNNIKNQNFDNDDFYFRWRGEQSYDFKSWQIVHYRLLGDSYRFPYGTSILEPARRIWRNILLVEDAMRTIRLLRATDRRVFYVNVGNIDSDDVPAYVDDIANRYKRKKHVDPQTGQEDLKYNVLGIDQDYIIPIRGSDDGSKIETLAGQTNLDIADIEYDFNQLFAALKTPKSFLGYEETAGDGKNLSMQDIRFARTINRIQQAIIMELNKIAIVHLYMIGLEDQIGNFTLTLNNPSTQSEIVRLQLLQDRISLFKDLVGDCGNGLAAFSYTKACKEIFGMSESEIEENLIQQRFEKAVSNELYKTENVIKKTGFFEKLDSLYRDIDSDYDDDEEGEEGEDNDSSGELGGGGGIGGNLDFDDDLGGDEDLGGEDLGDDEIGGDDDLGDDDSDFKVNELHLKRLQLIKKENAEIKRLL